jgi:hypothetical protein
MLKASAELYEMRVAQIGEVSEYTIRAGKSYSINLREANRGDESRELLTKLLATSKQVFGLDHNTTKDIESELKKNEAIERVMMKLAALKQVVAEREIESRLMHFLVAFCSPTLLIRGYNS